MRKFGMKLLLLWKKYERHINLSALALGFAFDFYLAKRPDSIVDNILLIAYLCIVGAVIVMLNVQVLRRKMDREHPTQTLLLLIVLQFCFGGLANNMLILYGKSGTIGGSLFFVALLGGFALGNEFLKSRYEQLRLNVAIYYFLLLTYCVIAVPTFILHSIGATVFLVSGVISLVAIAPFLWLLYFRVFKKREKRQMLEVGGIIAGIFLVFNILYFTNIIPPVPLSLKEIGIYHTLGSDGAGGYAATYEAPAWYVFWRDTSGSYTFAPGTDAYCFSAVFAPGSLSTPIVHTWEKYDDATSKWVQQSTYSFPINGGRAGGYRGWTEQVLTAGKWRCDVETSRGQLIGRISFTAVQGATPMLSTTTL